VRLQAHFEEQDPGHREQRASARRELRLDLPGHTLAAGEAAVTIRDISLTGLLIETPAQLACGDSFQIELPEGGQVEAKVVWNSGLLFGCEFDRPISPASLSAALLKGEARPAEVSRAVEEADVLGELQAITAQVQKITARVERTLRRLSEDKDDSGDS
jgi:hypothetical protein